MYSLIKIYSRSFHNSVKRGYSHVKCRYLLIDIYSIINPFNPKYLEWYGSSIDLEHTIQNCRSEALSFHFFNTRRNLFDTKFTIPELHETGNLSSSCHQDASCAYRGILHYHNHHNVAVQGVVFSFYLAP